MKRNVYKIETKELIQTISVPAEEGKGWESFVEALWACQIRDAKAVKNVKHVYCAYGSTYGEHINWQNLYLEAIKGRA